MAEYASLGAGLTLLCCGLLIYGAIHDVVGRTIPNRIALLIALIGLLQAARGHTLLASALVSAAIFAAGFLAYRQGLLGGGDVKLLAATSLLISPWRVPLQLEAIAIAGGLLAILYLLAGTLVPAPAPARPPHRLGRALRVEMWRIRRRGPLPYGVAIAFGTVTLLAGH